MTRDGGGYLASDPMLERIERQMDDLVARLLRRPVPVMYQRAWSPRTDVYETDTEFALVVELAGVDPGAVTIEIEGAEITISGQRVPSAPPEGADILQLEIPFGAFERRLALPGPVDAGRAQADFAEGMLLVRLPKVNEGPTRVQIAIQPPRG